MNKIVRFHAALIMMCVVALSVSLGSCDKNEVDSHDENSLSLKVDTNGVNFTLTPLINWKANLTDVEKYMAKYFPDFDVCYNGELKYDEYCGDWSLRYESHINMSVSFFFGNEQGDGLDITVFKFASSCNVDKIREELSGLGFKFMGLVYTDGFPDELEYMYLSNDEKLEVQFIVYNCGDEDCWYLTFQPTDWNDLDYLIDQSALSLNINSVNDSCCVTPLMDWGVSFTDVKRFMTQNYPDWELQNNGELICDTISEDSLQWYAKYQKGDFGQFFVFNNADGEGYHFFQFGDYASIDEIPLDRELTRNGLVYMGRDTTYYEEGISNHVYVPLSKDYIAVASAWIAHGGCRTIYVGPYDEEYFKLVSKD